MFKRHRRALIAAVAGAILAWLVAPHVFTGFAPIRHKVVREPVAASGGQLLVQVPANAALESLRTPFAAISQVRNDGSAPLTIQIVVDGREICAAEVRAGRSERIDCAIRDSWSGATEHSVRFSSSAQTFTVEYFELATHHGALTPGPRDAILVPAGSPAFQSSSIGHLLEIGALLMISIASVRHRRLPRVLSAIHLALAAIVAAVLALTILSSLVSGYSLLVAQWRLEQMLLVTALPVLVFRFRDALTWSRERPAALPVYAGIVVGILFWSGIAQRVALNYQGNISGVILISHPYFDKSPVAAREDVVQSLRFAPGGGYDGQFFYLMTFDPFLTAFRHEPGRYREYIDLPPYRYGRIGFSLFTKVFSGDRPARYPVTMVALVLAGLAISAMLLAALARSFGLSPWLGLLILVIPGFWDCTMQTLPEPVAIAFVLGAYLCARYENWWACGALLGLAMLVRETSGGLVLALPVGMAVLGKWRESIIVAALAFVPVILWKGFVGWVFWDIYGMAGMMPHPDNAGLPFAGVVQLWGTIARGEYFDNRWEMVRSGWTYPILTTAAAVLSMVVAIKRPSPAAGAAAFYALLTITFNYAGVWLHVGNAQRLTIDLFVALALVTVYPWRGRRAWPGAIALFWAATAVYVLFLSYEAAEIRHTATRLFTNWG